jgi:Cu+-exporting ATPase
MCSCAVLVLFLCCACDAGTSVAYAASVVSAVKTGGESFFETSALLITFVVLGKWLETMAKSRTTSALLKLLDMQPRECVA